MERPERDDAERISKVLHTHAFRAQPARGHGAPTNRRWIVETDDGRRAFVKIAAFDYTAEWLRLEHANYEAFRDLRCVPELLG